MSHLENASKFFHACETAAGWDACKDYVADGATFTAQSEPLVDIATLKDYVDWMYGFATGPAVGATYDLHTSAYG